MADILIIGAGGVGSVVAHKCAQVAKDKKKTQPPQNTAGRYRGWADQ